MNLAIFLSLTIVCALATVLVAYIGFRAWVEVVRLQITDTRALDAANAKADSAVLATNTNTKEVLERLEEVKRRVVAIEAGRALRGRG